MTLESAPWALDGARITSASARRASYAETGGAEGIISIGDLKVTPLDVPGVGVQISAGGALLLNRYQASPVETYTITNVGTSVLGSELMPPANPAAQSHLVCVTIGDPEFTQTGHPWMTSDPIPTADAEDFQYVRFVVIPNVPSTTTRFKQLNASYPGYALARIDVPANTSTITSEMIVDVRNLARPRTASEVMQLVPYVQDRLTYSGWKQTTIKGPIFIPDWANIITCNGTLDNVVHENEGEGELAIMIEGIGQMVSTLVRTGEHSSTNWHDFLHFGVGGRLSIPPEVRGTWQWMHIMGVIEQGNEGAVNGPAFLRWDGNTTAIIEVGFQEAHYAGIAGAGNPI
jgi:hypothetical protein